MEASEKALAPHASTLAWKIPWTEEPGRLQSMGSLKDATERLHFHFSLWRRKWRRKWQLEKEMAVHASVLAWRIPGTGEPGGLPSTGSHKVGHDWSNLAAVAAANIIFNILYYLILENTTLGINFMSSIWQIWNLRLSELKQLFLDHIINSRRRTPAQTSASFLIAIFMLRNTIAEKMSLIF